MEQNPAQTSHAMAREVPGKAAGPTEMYAKNSNVFFIKDKFRKRIIMAFPGEPSLLSGCEEKVEIPYR